MTSPGCHAIVGSMPHLSVLDEFVLRSHSLVSQPDLSTTGEQAAVLGLCVDHYKPNQTKLNHRLFQRNLGPLPNPAKSMQPCLKIHPPDFTKSSFSHPTIGGLCVILEGCYLVTQIKPICLVQQEGDLLRSMTPSITRGWKDALRPLFNLPCNIKSGHSEFCFRLLFHRKV